MVGIANGRLGVLGRPLDVPRLDAPPLDEPDGTMELIPVLLLGLLVEPTVGVLISEGGLVFEVVLWLLLEPCCWGRAISVV